MKISYIDTLLGDDFFEVTTDTNTYQVALKKDSYNTFNIEQKINEKIRGFKNGTSN